MQCRTGGGSKKWETKAISHITRQLPPKMCRNGWKLADVGLAPEMLSPLPNNHCIVRCNYITSLVLISISSSGCFRCSRGKKDNRKILGYGACSCFEWGTWWLIKPTQNHNLHTMCNNYIYVICDKCVQFPKRANCYFFKVPQMCEASMQPRESICSNKGTCFAYSLLDNMTESAKLNHVVQDTQSQGGACIYVYRSLD